ncbi:MAG: alpha/beta hydrolase [Pseudomonadota bacterium]
MASSNIRCDFVLIHGAWHGSWCWEPVREKLETAGHRVLTPTLPGLAERQAELRPDLGLTDHIADVRDLIEREGLSDFVLVGHSYGGMVITGVADALKDRIAHIVYLDAALPKNGESMVSYGAPRSAEALAAGEQAIKGLASDGIAMSPFPASLLGVAQDHPLHDWTERQLTPHPLKTWLDPIVLRNGGPEGLPKTYIHCTEPALAQSQFPWLASQLADDPAWRYATLKTGHEAMITAPRDVAALLIEAADSTLQMGQPL